MFEEIVQSFVTWCSDKLYQLVIHVLQPTTVSCMIFLHLIEGDFLSNDNEIIFIAFLLDW